MATWQPLDVFDSDAGCFAVLLTSDDDPSYQLAVDVIQRGDYYEVAFSASSGVDLRSTRATTLAAARREALRLAREVIEERGEWRGPLWTLHRERVTCAACLAGAEGQS